jgi:hypothetical protein
MDATLGCILEKLRYIQDLADIKKASARSLDAVFFPRRIVALAQLPYAVWQSGSAGFVGLGAPAR